PGVDLPGVPGAARPRRRRGAGVTARGTGSGRDRAARLMAANALDTGELSLAPDTLLQLAPGVRTRFDATAHLLVDGADGTVVDVGPRGLATLSLFAEPLALGEAIDRLEAGEHAASDFVPALSVLNMLIEEGALVRPGAARGPSSGWADPVEHARM